VLKITKTGGLWPNVFICPIFDHPGRKIGQKFLSDKKVGLLMSFQLTPLNFFGGQP